MGVELQLPTCPGPGSPRGAHRADGDDDGDDCDHGDSAVEGALGAQEGSPHGLMVMMMVMVMIVRMMTMLVATHCLFRITPKMDDVLLDELQRKFQVPHRLIKNDFS